jgi:predicted secreted protein
MTITGAIVLFAVLWFLILYMLLPQGVKSQSETGDVAPGTPGSAPSEPMLKRKLIWTTIITTIAWALIVGVIMSGWIHINDLDWFGRVDRD